MSTTAKKRGIFLTIMLLFVVLSFFLNIIGMISPSNPKQMYLSMHFQTIWFIWTILGGVGVIASFFWQKWGVLTIIILAILSLLFDIFILHQIVALFENIGTLVLDILLIWSVARKWHDFA